MQIGRIKKKNNQDHRNRKGDPGYYNYNSSSHKKWREKVKAKSHGLCVHCKDPNIRNKDGSYGERLVLGLVADHIIPIKQGGDPLDVSNGQFLCRYHDAVKSNKDKKQTNKL